MLKILQARLQEYVNHVLPDVQAGFRKGRGMSNPIANICWVTKKAREFQKKKCICALLTMPQPLTVWKILKKMGISDHLACFLRNQYADQTATVKTGHGTTGWFKLDKGVRQSCIFSPCLFNLYAEYIV